MFCDAQQVEQAILASQKPQRPADPVREVVQLGAMFLLGRSVGKLLKRQAVDAQNRCW